MSNQDQLQRSLGYRFSDQTLLTLALSHRSVGATNNERLEFLGDSILNHVIAEALYAKYPAAREGDLSRMRASLVKGDTLAEVASELDLGDYLLLGTGERKSGGHRRHSILADALEAITGAVLLDSDVAQCRECLLRWFATRLANPALDVTEKDPKTRLQEYLQGRRRPLPVYELLCVTGEDHNQKFDVACRMQNPEMVMQAAGNSRQRAEQAVAELVLENIKNHGTR